VPVDLPDERLDDGFGVEYVQAADVVQQFYKLVVYFSLIFWFAFLLGDFLPEYFDEFRFEEHFLDGDEDFEYHFEDFALGVLEADAVGDGEFVVDEFVPVEGDQVVQLVVDDLELFPDELFEQEDVPVLVYVVESVQVGADGAADLPAVAVLEAFEAVAVGVDVFEFADVDEVLAFHDDREEFEEAGHVALFWGEGEVVASAAELHLVFVQQSFEFVVLEAIHQQFLVYAVAFIVEQQDASEGEQDLAFLVVGVGDPLLVIAHEQRMEALFLVDFDAGFQGGVDDL
jgi:hypothetical protein